MELTIDQRLVTRTPALGSVDLQAEVRKAFHVLDEQERPDGREAQGSHMLRAFRSPQISRVRQPAGSANPFLPGVCGGSL